MADTDYLSIKTKLFFQTVYKFNMKSTWNRVFQLQKWPKSYRNLGSIMIYLGLKCSEDIV